MKTMKYLILILITTFTLFNVNAQEKIDYVDYITSNEVIYDSLMDIKPQLISEIDEYLNNPEQMNIYNNDEFLEKKSKNLTNRYSKLEDKLTVIVAYICVIFDYSLDYIHQQDDTKQLLKDKKTVCGGYSNLLLRMLKPLYEEELLQEIGILYSVNGMGPHSTNSFRIDENFYNLDLSQESNRTKLKRTNANLRSCYYAYYYKYYRNDNRNHDSDVLLHQKDTYDPNTGRGIILTRYVNMFPDLTPRQYEKYCKVKGLKRKEKSDNETYYTAEESGWEELFDD